MLTSVTNVWLSLGQYRDDLLSWMGGATVDEDTGDLTPNDSQESFITNAVRSVQGRMERDLHIRYDTKVIKARPEPGVQFDIREDGYDFWMTDYQTLGFLKLRRRPVISVDRVRLVYGADNVIVTYPPTWIRLDRNNATIQILPAPGTGWGSLLLTTGGYFLPLLTAAWLHEQVPQLICVDYTVGGIVPTQGDLDYWWQEHCTHCTRLAVRDCLAELSDVEKPGMASESIGADGLSESTQWTRGGRLKYADKMDWIEAEYKRFKEDNQGQTKPILFTQL